MTQYTLIRRGYDFGSVSLEQGHDDDLSNWQQGMPILLKKMCLDRLTHHRIDIQQSRTLYEAVLDEQECDSILAQPPYHQRIEPSFESLGCSVNEGDDQEIETVLFDAVSNGDLIAEDLWMKVSWLSFCAEDASLRFRFSFGVDHVEDVAADAHRQHYAALLTEAIFPESRLLTQNEQLVQQLRNILGCDQINFVERIVYFNSPNGGAYLHHDRERGHAGVVYAQLSGATVWLALPKATLLQEISLFVDTCLSAHDWPATIPKGMQHQLAELLSQPELLSSELDSFANNAIIQLINETKAFVQQLVSHGHARLVESGDVLLLPQESISHCCWHSVFNVGDDSGEALSFAVRAA